MNSRQLRLQKYSSRIVSLAYEYRTKSSATKDLSLIVNCSRTVKSFNIDNPRTSPYNPSTNTMAEWYHVTLNQVMGKVVSDTQREWNLHAPAAAAAYRASKHVVTWFTPNFMMLVSEVRAPVDLVIGHQQTRWSFGQTSASSSLTSSKGT